jgi:hypothetical protein
MKQHGARLLLSATGKARILCLLIGCLAALAIGLLLNRSLPAPEQVSVQGGRLVDMQRSILVLDHGGPPLLGVSPPNSPKIRLIPPAGASLSRHAHIRGLAGQLYAVGPGDDQGMYLYVPLLAHYFGARDPRVVLRDMYLGLAVLAALLYPLLFYEIFGSLLAGALAPMVLSYILRYAVPLIDVYWAPALLLLLAMPLLFALKRRRQLIVVLGIAMVCLLASISDSIRSYTGVGLFVAAVIASFRWTKTWKSRVAALTVALLAMLSVYPFALNMARSYRNHEIGSVSIAKSSATHPLWHQIYLGLSYIQPNRYGLEYDDTDGLIAALLYDPTVVAQSPAYERDVEHAFAAVLVHDPGYFLADYGEKLTAVIDRAAREYVVGLAVCMMALLLWRGHRRESLTLWLCVLIVTALPPVLAVPLDEYQLPWLAMSGLALFFSICGPLANIENLATVQLKKRLQPQAYPRLLPEEWRGSIQKRARVVPIVALVGALVTALVLDHENSIWSARFSYASAATPPELALAQPASAEVAGWSFQRRHNAWLTYPGTHLKLKSSGTEVRTGTGPFGYQVAGPQLSLAPGKYVVRVRGIIQTGGMSLGVLDLANEKWLDGSTGNFWYGQSQGRGFVMDIKITNNKRTPVQVVLSNWRPGGGSSLWDISSVAILADAKS